MTALPEDVALAFRSIPGDTEAYSFHSLKPGEFSSANHRPITCLSTVYKGFTSCLLSLMEEHLNKCELMEA